MDIKGKNVLITGGAKRIGKHLSINLAKEGANVAIHYRSSLNEAKEVLEKVRSFNINCEIFTANLENPDEVEKLAKEVLDNFGTIDILINNASLYYPTPLFDDNLKDLDRFYNIHIKAPFILSKLIGKHMLNKKEGRIINIVDYSPLRPYKDFTPYIVSKGGLLTLTKALAKELAPYVLVNAILPGPIIPAEDISDVNKPLEKTLLKKWAGEEEIFKAVRFLIESDFITGSFIPVEGGRLQC